MILLFSQHLLQNRHRYLFYSARESWLRIKSAIENASECNIKAIPDCRFIRNYVSRTGACLASVIETAAKPSSATNHFCERVESLRFSFKIALVAVIQSP
ncbi:hypothetical protein HNY73_003262 [Argiope bruennichi]|uniref:Uncharacterized protein n=1 Tax=Argiope bruennichi TaxID=94029 RepID=A0A8T0FWF0_ARGBR|nr:hypothetical protein HNY73_003262 [Argiope bruennichi]